MNDNSQTAVSIIVDAASTVVDQGVVGALLILSLAANVALVVALVRCYRRQSYGGNHGGFDHG